MLLEPESKKFGPQAPQNCSEIEANGSTKAEFLPRSFKSYNFLEIQWFLTSKWDPKINKIRFENEVEKTTALRTQI